MRVLVFSCLIWSCAIVKAQECEPNEGKKQSPVNINTLHVKVAAETPLEWSKEYSQSQSWELINPGHTLQLRSRFNVSHELSGGSLGATYTLEQLHFHWATTNAKGSEHTINNHSFPLEMHAVHTQYTNPNANTFTVVTYVFKISEKDNRIMRKILEPALKAAQETNVPQEVKPFALSDLFEKRSVPYFAYDGSLTTPPFTESVNWIIFTRPLTISQAQLNIFRAAAKISPDMKNNYRCVQALNGRAIVLVKQSPAFHTYPHRG